MKTKRQNFGRFNQPVACRMCGKNTTWSEANGYCGLDLCRDCFEAASLENEHFDGHHANQPHADCPHCKQSRECGLLGKGSEMEEKETNEMTVGTVDLTPDYKAIFKRMAREAKAQGNPEEMFRGLAPDARAKALRTVQRFLAPLAICANAMSSREEVEEFRGLIADVLGQVDRVAGDLETKTSEKPITHRLCTEEQGGEHDPVSATDEQLTELGLYPIDASYDDGVPTWQGSSEAVGAAWSRYGVRA